MRGEYARPSSLSVAKVAHTSYLTVLHANTSQHTTSTVPVYWRRGALYALEVPAKLSSAGSVAIVFEIPNDGIEEANIVFNIQTEARIYVSLKRAGVYEEIELYGDLFFKSGNKLYDYENILYSLIMQEQFNHANSVEVEFFYKIFENILDSEKKLVKYPQKYSFMKEIDQLRENYKNSR